MFKKCLINGIRIPISSSEMIPIYGFFSEILCESVDDIYGKNFVDLGCGSGVIGIYLLLRGAGHVLFNDIQGVAIDTTLNNLRLNTLNSGYSVFCGDFIDLEKDNLADIDLIVFNPPQFPAMLCNDISDCRNNIFRYSGNDGLKLFRKFVGWFSSIPYSLEALLPMSSLLYENKIISEVIKYENLSCSIIRRVAIPLRESFLKKVSSMSLINQIELGVSKRPDESLMEQILLIKISIIN